MVLPNSNVSVGCRQDLIRLLLHGELDSWPRTVSVCLQNLVIFCIQDRQTWLDMNGEKQVQERHNSLNLQYMNQVMREPVLCQM